MTAEDKTEQSPNLNNGNPQEIDVPELAALGPDEKNWRGIGIALLVIFSVCALIVTAVVLLTPVHKDHDLGKTKIEKFQDPDQIFGSQGAVRLYVLNHNLSQPVAPADIVSDILGGNCPLCPNLPAPVPSGDNSPHTGKSRITLNEVLNGSFSYQSFNGTWLSGHEFLYRDTHGALEIFNVQNNSRRVVMPNETFKHHGIYQYSISPDRTYVLLASNYQRVFRYTYTAVFLVYNISTGTVSPLFPDTPELQPQYVAWGPTGNQMVYVLENNIYYLSSISAKPRQLTTSGVEDIIFNGVPDWVYEEEILTSSHALWWSSNGKKLCYATFNDTEVDEMMYPYYGSYKDLKNAYPEIINLRYPKPGRKNPTVTLWVTDLTSNREPRVVNPPREYKDTEYYFTRAQWVNNDSLFIIWLKRSQNTSIISLCAEKDNWNCVKNVQVDSNGHGWVSLYKYPIFTADKEYYFIILPGPPEGTSGRFQHIAMINVNTAEIRFLTKGKYDVVDILSYDSEQETVYYITTLEGKPSERHLFSVTDITAPKPPKNLCLTCDLGPQCLYNDATFSTNATYYALDCGGPGIPRTEIRSRDSVDPVFVLEVNEPLKERVDRKALPKVKKLQVPLPGNFSANVKLLLPPSLREDEITKYPLILTVYGGPGSQLVKESFSIGWDAYLASNKNFIYASIDGRGSGFQGNKMLFAPYRKLGTVEVSDQIIVTKYLKETLPYIDSKRIAVFGWSYGGYVSAMILATDEEKIFSCGISVAPVTSWRYYDSVYTERYMQLPTAKDNLKSYEDSEVMRRAASFKGKKYLLVHGTADDNVHWQQSVMLAKSLVKAGILFKMQIYPDERHSLLSVKQHLYHTVDEFLDHCFTESDDISSETNDA